MSGGSSHHKKNVWKTLWKKISSLFSGYFLLLCVLWFHFSFTVVISTYWLMIHSSPNLALCKQFITTSLLCLTLRYRNLHHLNFLTQQLWTAAGLLVSHLNLQVRPPEVEPPASFFVWLLASLQTVVKVSSESRNLFQSTCIDYFFIGHIWVDCNVTWKIRSSPSPSFASTSRWTVCWIGLPPWICGKRRHSTKCCWGGNHVLIHLFMKRIINNLLY